MSDRLRDEELAEIAEYNSSYIEIFGTGSVVDMQVHALLAEITELKAENAKLTESLKQWRELVPTMSDLYRCSKCGYYHDQPVTSDWECRQHHKKTEQWITEVTALKAENERLADVLEKKAPTTWHEMLWHDADTREQTLTAENAKLKALIREVMSDHADPESPSYNECGDVVCDWCERAKQILEAGNE